MSKLKLFESKGYTQQGMSTKRNCILLSSMVLQLLINVIPKELTGLTVSGYKI
jgi:hypothetical protein